MSNDETNSNIDILKQARLMQEKIAAAQEAARQKTMTATSGGGMVTATINGACQLVALQIDPVVVDPKEMEMLTDLIISAVNQAIAKAQVLATEELANISWNINLSKLF
ncbi:MAG: YbaB/EbfC family nucleoid-associated protein [Deltaproteobacteria bacterium]|jgi:DNA-binding YbaB/EbfC family protein|nr:YbaB/EbfC family nucleoid-associated protein [Deltaproteobacteria bacterium]